MTRRRVHCPKPQGACALATKAWGEDVEIIVKGSVAGKPFAEEGDYAVVDICGPLSQHDQWLFDSYDAVRQRVGAALASDKPSVCLRINSPGGDFAGVLELGRDLRAMADAAGKRLMAYTDGQALSAAYAIAAVCDEISVAPSAFVGSVGIWAPLIDQTKADSMMGLAYVIVSSGERKAERNPHVAISESAVTTLQGTVDAQAQLFFEHVATFRGLAAPKVEALQGAEVMGSDAVARGLADAIVDSWGSYVTRGSAPQAKGTSMSKYDEALGAMRRAAEEDSEDGKKAKKCLKAWEDGEKPEKEKEGEGEGKAAAKSKGEGEEKEKEKEKEKEGEGEGKAAALATPLDAIRAVHELRSELAAKAEAEERTALLASRPDFDPSVRSFLAKASIESVREAVKTFPRIGNAARVAAAGNAMPLTLGAQQGDMVLPLSAEQEARLEKAMGGGKPSDFFFGCADLDAARRHLAKRAAEEKGV